MVTVKRYKLELVVTLFWLVVIFLINPIGDFPLNDDWCYAKSVKTLLDHNYLKVYNWGEMTLIGQVYWGFLFTKLFGFSFTVLRFSTLILALISSFGLIKLFKLIDMSQTLILASIAFIIFNPIFLELSFTFMTDIPFYTITVFILYYFIKAIKTENNKYIYYAIICCAVAYSIRQLALIYPLSWFVYSILHKKPEYKSVFKSVLLLIVFLGFAICFEFILKSLGVMQERYNSKLHLLFNNLFSLDKAQIVYSVVLLLTSITYLGLFFSPLIVLNLKVTSIKFRIIFILIYTLLVFCVLYKYDYILPSLDNIWIDFGVGPFTLYNENAHFKTTPTPNLSQWFYYLITLLGIVSSAVLFFEFFNRLNLKSLKGKFISKIRLFIVITAVIYLGPFLIVGLYDRYLLPLFPLLVVFIFYRYKPKLNRYSNGYIGLFLVFLIWFSVCATHDYLSWNRKRWEVLNYLIKEQKIPTSKINGGAEFITWYHFSEKQEKWWENVTPEYTLTTDVNLNDTVLETYSYSRWLPGKGVLFLIHNKTLQH